MHDEEPVGSTEFQSSEFAKLPPTPGTVIPLSRPSLVGRERDYVLAAMASEVHQGDGPFTRRCHDLLEGQLGVARALLTTSCTTALEMAAILARRGDPGRFAGEVICPSYTFPATAGAFALHGYAPVFADVRADTLNLDESKVEELITPRTRAIVAVHYAGVPCEMDTLARIARAHDLVLVEDAAQAIFSRYHGRPAGALGDMAAFSFHATKNLSCGEGGAITFRDEGWATRAEIIREKGTNRNQFLRGFVDKYTWVDIGGSYLPSELLAACLLAQLEGAERIQSQRRACYERYVERLAPLSDAGLLRLPVIPEGVESNHHLFFVRVDSVDTRDRLTDALRAEGIMAVFHYAALHRTPMGIRFGERSLPVAEEAAETVLRLPLYAGLSLEDVDRVVDAIERFYGTSRAWSRACAI